MTDLIKNSATTLAAKLQQESSQPEVLPLVSSYAVEASDNLLTITHTESKLSCTLDFPTQQAYIIESLERATKLLSTKASKENYYKVLSAGYTAPSKYTKAHKSTTSKKPKLVLTATALLAKNLKANLPTLNFGTIRRVFKLLGIQYPANTLAEVRLGLQEAGMLSEHCTAAVAKKLAKIVMTDEIQAEFLELLKTQEQDTTIISGLEEAGFTQVFKTTSGFSATILLTKMTNSITSFPTLSLVPISTKMSADLTEATFVLAINAETADLL